MLIQARVAPGGPQLMHNVRPTRHMQQRLIKPALAVSIVGATLALGQVGKSPDEPLGKEALGRAAIEATGLRPSACTVDKFNGFFNPWAEHQILRVSHSTQPHIFPVVAVADDGSALLLSGDTHHGERDATIARFNQIQRREEVTLDQHGPAELIELFLAVHLTNAGAYLPSLELVHYVRSLDPETSDYTNVRRALQQIRLPIVVRVEERDGKYIGTAYGWRFWTRSISRYEVTLLKDATIEAIREHPLDP